MNSPEEGPRVVLCPCWGCFPCWEYRSNLARIMQTLLCPAHAPFPIRHST